MREDSAAGVALLTKDELASWRGFLRVHAALARELDAELIAGHGLPLSSYEVLLTVADAPEERMRMSEIADSVLLSRSGVTRLVDRLERDGLVERIPCEDDARGQYAVLTAARPRGVRRRPRDASGRGAAAVPGAVRRGASCAGWPASGSGSSRARPGRCRGVVVSRSLDTYRRKRDPAKTPEPFSGDGGGGNEPIFVVQRHDARRLHFDFRIERGGALQSWAVPKGIPLRKGQRHLAVHVEDHPLDYADVRGRDPGRRVRRRDGRDLGSRPLRAGRGEARRRPDRAPARRAPERPVDARADADRRRRAQLAHDPQGRGRGRRGSAADLRPMLAVAASELPTAGNDWVYEVKWDGYRVIAAVDGGERDAAQPQRQRPHRALRRRWRARSRARCAAPTACSTARCARSTRTAGRASRCSSTAAARSPCTSSTCCGSTAAT